jgi:hypothetical protein
MSDRPEDRPAPDVRPTGGAGGAVGPRRNRTVVLVVLVGSLVAAVVLVSLCAVTAYLVNAKVAREVLPEPQPVPPAGPAREEAPAEPGVAGAPAVDPDRPEGDPYDTNWRRDFDRADREMFLAKAEVAADELRKAGVQLHEGVFLWATPGPKHFTADGRFRPEILQSMRVAGVSGLRVRGGEDGVPFGDAALRQLDRLRCLNEVEIRECDVTDDGLAGLSALKDLRYLEVSGTKDEPLRLTGKGFVHLRAARELVSVTVDFARLDDEGMMALGEHPTLHSLWLVENRITDAGIAHLRGCPRLERLYLRGNPITGTGFRGLPQTLDDLFLESCPITDDGAAAIAGLRVRELAVSSDKLTDAGGVALAKTALLRELGLSGAAVGDPTAEALAASPTLQELRLTRTGVSDAGLLALAAAPRLKKLEVFKCPQVTAAGVAKLQANKPGIAVRLDR